MHFRPFPAHHSYHLTEGLVVETWCKYTGTKLILSLISQHTSQTCINTHWYDHYHTQQKQGRRKLHYRSQSYGGKQRKAESRLFVPYIISLRVSSRSPSCHHIISQTNIHSINITTSTFPHASSALQLVPMSCHMLWELQPKRI